MESDINNNTLLRRKAEVGRKEHQSRAMSVQKALRVCLAKVADQQLELAMSAIGITQGQASAEDLEKDIDPADLFVLLDGPTAFRGAAMLDSSLVTGLIQQQTMGRVSEDAGAGPRAMTATDAAMCAPFLDGLLAMAAPLPEMPDDRELLQGYSFGARAEDVRLLLMALEAPAYRIFKLTIDIALGRRQGRLILILPVPSEEEALPPEGDDEPSTKHLSASTLGPAVMASQAELMVVLSQLNLTLAQVSEMAVGDTFSLESAAFDKAMVYTAEGRRLNSGTLGQVAGMRALRLDHAPKRQDMPQRRASDRAAVDQPVVMPLDSNKTVSTNVSEAVPLQDLPDMSDLPGLTSELADNLATGHVDIDAVSEPADLAKQIESAERSLRKASAAA